jgi:energy-coupling factor transport system permease protein
MLVTWRYRERNSLIQSFDPRARMIFFLCFIASTLLFWDLRYLLFFAAITLAAVLASRITWEESKRAWLFIGSFITFYSLLTFLTGRGGVEVYSEEHPSLASAPFTILGWRRCSPSP